jgi:hypothetical protein
MNRCNAICGANAKGFGNYVVIKHPTGLYTAYHHLSSVSVTLGKEVSRGDVIGQIGNTGASEGAHLDFKVYSTPINVHMNEKGENPLCYFPEEELKKLRAVGTSNCAQYGAGGISRSNPVFVEACKNVQPLLSKPPCTFGAASSDIPSNTQISKLLDTPGGKEVSRYIDSAGAAYGIDPRWLKAQMVTESYNDRYAISPVGAAGTSQFMYYTAQEVFKGIASADQLALIKDCNCRPDNGVCMSCDKRCGSGTCQRDTSVCTQQCNKGDPRFNVELSVKAQAKYMHDLWAHEELHAKGSPDGILFAIAAYNAGPGGVDRAIARTGKPNPTYVEIESHLPTETQKYVKTISEYYVQLGGSLGSYAGVVCSGTPTGGEISYNGITVKEIGSYTFNPSFSVDLPYTPDAMQKVADFAKKAYTECDGSNDIDVRKCLADHKTALAASGLTALDTCEDENTTLMMSFDQAVKDCMQSGQLGCYCSWSPPKEFNHMTEVDLYDKTGRFFIDGNSLSLELGKQESYVKMNAADAPRQAFVILWQQDAKHNYARSMVVAAISDTSGVNFPDSEITVPDNFTFIHYIDERGIDTIAWLGYTDPSIKACQPYSTTYPLCIQYSQSIPRLSKGTFESPKAKFSLYLKDMYPPKRPESLVATVTQAGMLSGTTTLPTTINPTTPVIRVTGKSPSPDVSYYSVGCKENLAATAIDMAGQAFGIPTTIVTGTAFTLQMPKDAVNVTAMPDGSLDAILPACDGKAITSSGKYDVAAFAIDLHGNKGEPAAVRALNPASTTGPTSSTTGSTG